MKTAKYLKDLRQALTHAEGLAAERIVVITQELGDLGDLIWFDHSWRTVPGRIARLVARYVALGGDPMSLRPPKTTLTPAIATPESGGLGGIPTDPGYLKGRSGIRPGHDPKAITRALQQATDWAQPLMAERYEAAWDIIKALDLKERLEYERDVILGQALGNSPLEDGYFDPKYSWRSIMTDLEAMTFHQGPAGVTGVRADAPNAFSAPITPEDLEKDLA